MSQETKVIEKHDVVIRFSGDSGDGMQLTGQQFSDTAALFGNDVATFPDYPAEIVPCKVLLVACPVSRYTLEKSTLLLRVIMPMSSWL